MTTDYHHLILATVISIKDTYVTYPCCGRCFSKLFPICNSYRWNCLKCGNICESDKKTWRYRLSLVISDDTAVCNICLFGNILQQYFGRPASMFVQNLQQLDRSYGSSEGVLLKAMKQVFLGKWYYFGFKTFTGLKRKITLNDILHHQKTVDNCKSVLTQNGEQFDYNITAYQMLSATDTKCSTVSECIRYLLNDHQDCIPNDNNQIKNHVTDDHVTSFQTSNISMIHRPFCSVSSEQMEGISMSFGQTTAFLSCEVSDGSSGNIEKQCVYQNLSLEQDVVDVISSDKNTQTSKRENGEIVRGMNCIIQRKCAIQPHHNYDCSYNFYQDSIIDSKILDDIFYLEFDNVSSYQGTEGRISGHGNDVEDENMDNRCEGLLQESKCSYQSSESATVSCKEDDNVKESVAVSCKEDGNVKESVAVSCKEDDNVKDNAAVSCKEDGNVKESVAVSCKEDDNVKDSAAVSCKEDGNVKESVAVSCKEGGNVKESVAVSCKEGGNVKESAQLYYGTENLTSYGECKNEMCCMEDRNFRSKNKSQIPCEQNFENDLEYSHDSDSMFSNSMNNSSLLLACCEEMESNKSGQTSDRSTETQLTSVIKNHNKYMYSYQNSIIHGSSLSEDGGFEVAVMSFPNNICDLQDLGSLFNDISFDTEISDTNEHGNDIQYVSCTRKSPTKRHILSAKHRMSWLQSDRKQMPPDARCNSISMSQDILSYNISCQEKTEIDDKNVIALFSNELNCSRLGEDEMIIIHSTLNTPCPHDTSFDLIATKKNEKNNYKSETTDFEQLLLSSNCDITKVLKTVQEISTCDPNITSNEYQAKNKNEHLCRSLDQELSIVSLCNSSNIDLMNIVSRIGKHNSDLLKGSIQDSFDMNRSLELFVSLSPEKEVEFLPDVHRESRTSVSTVNIEKVETSGLKCVKFASRLNHLKCINLIDLEMRLKPQIPITNPRNGKKKSCMKRPCFQSKENSDNLFVPESRDSKHKDSVELEQSNIQGSQDLFPPSPVSSKVNIFSNCLKKFSFNISTGIQSNIKHSRYAEDSGPADLFSDSIDKSAVESLLANDFSCSNSADENSGSFLCESETSLLHGNSISQSLFSENCSCDNFVVNQNSDKRIDAATLCHGEEEQENRVRGDNSICSPDLFGFNDLTGEFQSTPLRSVLPRRLFDDED